ARPSGSPRASPPCACATPWPGCPRTSAAPSRWSTTRASRRRRSRRPSTRPSGRSRAGVAAASAACVRRSRIWWSDDVTSPNDIAVEYVLGELSPEDAASFERRVAADPALGEEVRRLRATLDLIPFATVTEPPAHLRARVLAAGAPAPPPRGAQGAPPPRPRGPVAAAAPPPL